MTISAGPIPQPNPYVGKYSGYPAKICIPPQEGPRVQSLQIGWNLNDYPNLSVVVNLQSQGNTNSPINQIACLHIDNSSNTHATEIIFPDTGFRFIAPPLTTDYYPVITNNLQFNIINSGLTAGDTSNIIVMNFFVPGMALNENIPGVQYVLDSNGNIAPLVLADRVYSMSFSINSGGQQDIIVIPQTNWCVTAIWANVADLVANEYALVALRDGTGGQIIFNGNAGGPNNGATPQVSFNLGQVTGIQIKSLIASPLHLIYNLAAAAAILKVNVYYGLTN